MKQQFVVLREAEDVRTFRVLDALPRRIGSRANLFRTRGPIDVSVTELSDREWRKLLSDRNVTAAAPVMPMKLIEPVKRGVETDPGGGGRTSDSWGIAAVKADLVGDDAGEGVVVAVLDTGIDRGHPAFRGVQITGRNFTAGEIDAFDDDDGHGTHCAGTIFGRDVGGRRIGIARGVTQAVIGKVVGPGGGSSAQIVEAVQWAISEGAHVISMSLGIDFPAYIKRLRKLDVPEPRAYSMGLSAYRENLRLFDRLAALVAVSGSPTLLIAAAGNESQRDGNPPFELDVAPPAAADGFVSVAALERSPSGLRAASFSNSGAEVAAPGVDILSAVPGGGLALMSGTSMATPHVAGVAALWAENLASKNRLRASYFRTSVVGSATLEGIAKASGSDEVGAGIVQAPI